MTYDVLIIGAGPAGCSAALTLRNRNKTVLMAYTGDGALGLAEKINNCPGVRGKSGQEIAELYRAEALDAGAEIRKEKVSQLLPMGDTFSAIVGADIISARSVLLTIGASRGKEIPGEKELVGRGVSYCATCDAMLYRGRPVLVVGTDQEYLIAVCLFDETDLTRLTEEKEASQIVCGLLSLDNYDEAMEGVEDVRRSLLLALVERKINKYFGEVDCIIRKLSHDRFFFVMRKKSLLECEEQRFPILDDVKTVNIGNEMSLTLSIGIGCGEESYLANADIARNALELALGRGGDQVVVRDGFRTHFYGGNTESTEKITRVKARVKAQALQEIIESRSRVVVMGHKIADIDAIGAAIGIGRAARTVGVPVSIVADDISDNVRPVIESFRADQEYDADFFVTQERARELTGADTVLVVVDTNKPSYTACEELLGRTGSIVVLDHHRQGDDRITNAVLSYIEPYASSACEMVAEVLQYFGEDVKLRSIEADALYAGIVLDTSNFIARTGVRTFEAAAYLRRNGADVTRVRKMFRDDVEDCRAKAQAVADAEIFMDEFAVSVCPSEGLHSPTVVSAQAANELLNTRGIKATFVMTEYNGQVYISARAIDEVNVQLIMERLGGGGHLSVAGAQLSDYTLEEAKALLKSTIMEMKEEGDIA